MVGSENVNAAGGRLRDRDAQYLVRTLNQYTDAEDVAETIVHRDGERVVKLAEGNDAIDAMVKRGQLLGWCEHIDIATMALYLASDESASTTGQVILVDSGATIS